MNKKDVLKHFKGSPREIAAAIQITTQYVSQWRELIPESMASRLDRATDGALKYDPQIYIDAQREQRLK